MIEFVEKEVKVNSSVLKLTDRQRLQAGQWAKELMLCSGAFLGNRRSRICYGAKKGYYTAGSKKTAVAAIDAAVRAQRSYAELLSKFRGRLIYPDAERAVAVNLRGFPAADDCIDDMLLMASL